MDSRAISRLAAAGVAAGCFAIVAFALTRGVSEREVSTEAAASDTAEALASPEPIGADAETTAASLIEPSDTSGGEPSVESVGLPIIGESEPLEDLDGWLQTDASSIEEIGAPVTIVQFWTFGCFNCKNTLPHLQSIYGDYHDKGLEIVGVHAPEFDFEKDPVAIQQAAIDLGVSWPVALDTRRTNFRSWQGSRRFWPRTYVLDSQGRIRFDHVGEGAYDELEAVVAELLSAEQAG